MKNAIITGATGAIGMALIGKLLSQQVNVTVVLHKNSNRNNRIPATGSVRIVKADLSELSSLTFEQLGKQDVFYHFAWGGTFGQERNNTDEQLKNIQYTLDAVRLAKRLECKKFVGAGSQAEYGRYEGNLNSKVPTFPENGYGIAKLCAGQMSRLLCEQLGIEHIWTRILSVYGPYDGEKTMISVLVNEMLNKRTPSCTKGEQLWDYIYSMDAANAFYLLGLKGISGKTYCIGSGEAHPLKEYITYIRDAISPDLEIAFGAVSYSEKQVMHLCADISELEQDTGFKIQYSFQDGIMETIEWIKKEKKNEKD
jgi:nucleoside-diphosphate-sugar epimerase